MQRPLVRIVEGGQSCWKFAKSSRQPIGEEEYENSQTQNAETQIVFPVSQAWNINTDQSLGVQSCVPCRC